MANCVIEVPKSLCDVPGGTIDAFITEVGGKDPVTILTKGAHYELHVSVELTSTLKRMICGHWCICVASESIGDAQEKRECQRVDMTNCTPGPDKVIFNLDEAWFGGNEDDCGDVFKLAITAAAYNQCNDAMGLCGFCTFGPVMVQ